MSAVYRHKTLQNDCHAPSPCAGNRDGWKLEKIKTLESQCKRSGVKLIIVSLTMESKENVQD